MPESRRACPSFVPLIVGIGGTPRQDSLSECALRRALFHASSLGATTEIFVGRALEFPIYSPEVQYRTDLAMRLVDGMRRADGIIISSPAYHGSVSGLIKNALDYAEDLRNDSNTYLDGRAVGCIAVGSGWQATIGTLSALRTITHALRGWPTPLGACINIAADEAGSEGSRINAKADLQLKTTTSQVVEFAMMRSMLRSDPLPISIGRAGIPQSRIR